MDSRSNGPDSEGAVSVVAQAEELLSHRFGGVQRLTDAEELGGLGNALVLRVKVAPSPFLPHKTVVIKHSPATGYAIDDAALLREVVGYQFTTALPEAVRPGPVMLAYDIDKRIVVLTDAGDGDTLAEVLVSADDDRRLQILRTLGMELGQMHAGTAGRESDYDLLLARLLRKHPEYAEDQALRDDALRDSVPIAQEILRSAGLTPPCQFDELAVRATNSIQSGFDRAFTPFDLSPDNIIVAEKLHFLDYEWAGFRNVGFDVACVIGGFPQFLFSRPISDSEVDVFLSAWTREVKNVWPKFADGHTLHELVTSSLIGWALSSVTTMFAGGLDGILALSRGDAVVRNDPSTSILRPAEVGRFSDDELLIRRDLYETFEALARYAGRCNKDDFADVAEFSQRVATRLATPAV